MSVDVAAASVREGCVYVRIETAATGWAFSAGAQALVRAADWLHLEVDAHGLSGVAVGDDGWAERLGAVTRTLEELTTVELRHGVALVTVAASEARGIALAPDVIAVFGAAERWTFVVDPRALARFEPR